ncbi:MAG: ferredoxin [Candidatus Aminicenantes bacterium]
MKVTIDREECTMCGVCYDECPEVFEANEDDDLSQITEEYRVNDDLSTGEVPEDLRDSVTEAAEGCPVEVIHIE